MDMTGEQRIPAKRETVWAALNDADILQACIPGCQELNKTSDTDMTAVALVKVGPVTARFAGAVTLSDLDPPNGYRITGEGQGGVAGFAKGGAVVRLEADGDDTILHYEVSAQVGGKLSQLGGRLIDSTAKQMSGAFFKRFAEEIAAGPANQSTSAAPEGGAMVGATGGTSPAAAAAGSPDTSATPSPATPAPSTPAPATPAPARAPRAPSPPVDVTPGIFKHAGLIAIGVIVLLLLGALYLFGVPTPGSTMDPGQVSPDMTYTVQLLLVASIGYLFGRDRSAR